MKDSILAKPHICCILALLCCVLWGSAFPCIKIGYVWFSIEDTGSQILFAGYRFLLAGVITLGFGSLMERRRLTVKKNYIPQILCVGLLQTTVQYVFFYMALISSAGFGMWNALLKYNPVGKVAIFGFSIPVFGTLLSGLFLGEQIFRLEILLSLLMVCMGIIIVNEKVGKLEEGLKE